MSCGTCRFWKRYEANTPEGAVIGLCEWYEAHMDTFPAAYRAQMANRHATAPEDCWNCKAREPANA